MALNEQDCLTRYEILITYLLGGVDSVGCGSGVSGVGGGVIKSEGKQVF